MLKCYYCQKEFKKLACKHKYQLKTKKTTNFFFCNRKCYYSFYSANHSTQIKCANCNKNVKMKNCDLKKSKSGKHFCSKSCAGIYNNKLRKKSRRSKIEIKFYKLLVNEFPNLNIIANDKTMLDGLETDVAIPSLKLAIEWNGIIHFKPIYGQTTLDKIQSRDAKKLKIASNKNINLIVIPDLVSNNKILHQAFNDVKDIIKKLI